jgi:exodeoxyribonuclease VII small subunit
MAMAKSSNSNDIEAMEFETALQELEGIVDLLEIGKSSLKESVGLYERGIALKKHCDKILESAQLKINQISCDKTDSE